MECNSATSCVEFELDAGISDEEAKQLLGEDAGSAGKAKLAQQGRVAIVEAATIPWLAQQSHDAILEATAIPWLVGDLAMLDD
eukprot:1158743-Pelagomonas_calceolata.AAC.7